MLTERLVSLYFTLISAAVRRIASMASSSVTLYTPSLAMDSCAAVTAFTAVAFKGKVGICRPEQRGEERGCGYYLPPRLLRSCEEEKMADQWHNIFRDEKWLTMQGTWTSPSIGSHVRPRLCSSNRNCGDAGWVNKEKMKCQ